MQPRRSAVGLLTVVMAGLLALSARMVKAADYRATERARQVAAIATYQGPDRIQRLVAGARLEGKLTLYVSLNARLAEPWVNPFREWLRRNYGLTVDISLWRTSSEDVLRRAILEAQGGRFEADVFETTSPYLEILARETVTTRFWSPRFEEYPNSARDPQGYWHATRMYVFTQAYNTSLVRREQLPKTWNDLLDPRWRGRMAIEASDWDWFATLVKRGPFGSQEQALAFFDRLRAQELQVRSGHTLMSELLAAGEFPLALTVYNNTIEDMKRAGAPVDWFVIEPAVARASGIGVAANAPHPHMAMLFVEYALSVAGQQRLLELGVPPASPGAETNLTRGYRYLLADAQAIVDEAQQWQSLWEARVVGK